LEIKHFRGFSLSQEIFMLHVRPYHFSDDYTRISNFLIHHHQPGNLDGNWLEPIWEYMHGHPALEIASLPRIGIWEADGEIVAVAHYESSLGKGFFQFHSDYKHLREEMLDYAEKNLRGYSEKEGCPYLAAFANETEEAFGALLQARGYQKSPRHNRPMAKFVIPDPFPPITVPDGYCVKSLVDECDWVKVHRVMWRGFDHPGEPPMSAEELESRQKMFDTPRARRDLKIVVETPSGDFGAFCGMFYEPSGKFGFVEPVATDPTYRRLGLGRAAVLEGIRRCRDLGATVAYVGSDQAFYRSFGFEVLDISACWVKYFDN
jgi:GNAT superfamily N-acetyltransferase